MRLGALGLAAVLCIGNGDPLTSRVIDDDARRFAAVFEQTGGKPTAAQLQAGYLDNAGRGVAVFTPDRIENAEHLAENVAKNAANYAYAIRTCLPLVDSLNNELRATYLGYRGLLPNRPLPKVYVVFGAGNSGGTASPDAQVMGLEVVCGPGTTPDQFKATMRAMFGHETVHSWQPEPEKSQMKDLLLWAALREGVPDYLATVVTGRVPGPERDGWAREQEAWVWSEFEKDRALIIDPDAPASGVVFRRWFANFGNAPAGRPSELGYWVGMRIAERYVAQAADKHAAIEDLIALRNPQAILAASGYAPR